MTLYKTTKSISKSRKEPKRMNNSLKGTLGFIEKLQCRGTPEAILTIIQKLPNLTPNAVRALTFATEAEKLTLNYFSDRQIEEALELKNKKEFETNLAKKESTLTNFSSHFHKFIDKENFVEEPKYSERPQEAEPVFI